MGEDLEFEGSQRAEALNGQRKALWSLEFGALSFEL